MWEVVTGVQDERSTQAKVEGIMLKAAWHWGSNTSVTNNTFWEPGCTLPYTGLRSVWGSVDGDHIFFFCFMGELLNWGLFRDTNE